MNEPVRRPNPGEFTQGAIFNCAVAEAYRGSDAYGIIITARCDVANDKAPTYNYVPIVSLTSWLTGDGLRILSDRVKKSACGNVRTQLSNLEISPRVLMFHGLDQVASEFLPLATKKNKKHIDSLKNSIEVIKEADRILSEGDPLDIQHYYEKNEKIRIKILKELVSHQLTGFYFIPRVDGGDREATGYVALQREIHHLPALMAKTISEGLVEEKYHEMRRAGSIDGCRLRFNSGDFAMPIGQLTSPHIEHFMQALFNLFSRIGLPDYDDKYIEEIWNINYIAGQ